MKGTSQIKPRLNQGRAGLRCKVKTPLPPPINKPIVKLTEKPIEQPKVASKVSIPDGARIHIELHLYEIMQFPKQDPVRI